MPKNAGDLQRQYSEKRSNKRRSISGLFYETVGVLHRRADINMTIKELAEMANVSVSTVSKIVNGKDDSISEETRIKVLRLVKEYHYTPYASVLSGNSKSLVIGVMLRELQNIDRTLQGIIYMAQQSGYTLMLCVSHNDAALEYKHISSLLKNRVDGVLWELVSDENLKHAKGFDDAKVPYLLFDSHHPDAVNIDYQALGYQATKLLIENGHKEIGCLLTEGHVPKEVLQGYRRCLFDHGIPYHDNNIYYDISQSLLSKISSRLMSAVVSSDYIMSLQLYKVLTALHYAFPYDFSMVSLQDESHGPSTYPDISAYEIPLYSFGKHICTKLISKMETKADMQDIFQPQIRVSSMATVGIPYKTLGKKVLVVGSIGIDNYLLTDSPIEKGGVVTYSMLHQHPGGKGLNQAVGIAKMGHKAVLIGNMGNDADSDMIFNVLNQYNIDPKGVVRQLGSKTGKAYIFLDKSGSSKIVRISGNVGTLTPKALTDRQELFEHAEFCLVQTEISLETVEATCKIAKKLHIPTIVKPCACGPLSPSLLKLIDYLVPNKDELRDICPQFEKWTEQIDYLLDAGVGTVIVTQGAEGCYVKNRDIEKAFPVERMESVDTTGAGDAFISVFVSYLLYGYVLENAIRIAASAAGLCTTREGVISAMVEKDSLEFYLRQKGIFPIS